MLYEKIDKLYTLLWAWEANIGDGTLGPEVAYERIKDDPADAITTLQLLASRAQSLAFEIQFEFGSGTRKAPSESTW